MISELSKWARENGCGDYTPKTFEDWKKLALMLRWRYNAILVPVESRAGSGYMTRQADCIEIHFNFENRTDDQIEVHRKYRSRIDGRVYFGQSSYWSIEDLADYLENVRGMSYEKVKELYENCFNI